MSEAREIKIKRLSMRSMRRGIKEMDLILTDYAQTHLARLSDAELDLYDQLLEESDHDLYQWVCGLGSLPEVYAPLMTQIQTGAKGIVRPV